MLSIATTDGQRRLYTLKLSLWVREAGLPAEISPHWLRHTMAKRLMATTTHHNPLGVVQVALGHRNISSTGIYTRPDKESLREAMDLYQMFAHPELLNKALTGASYYIQELKLKM